MMGNTSATYAKIMIINNTCILLKYKSHCFIIQVKVNTVSKLPVKRPAAQTDHVGDNTFFAAHHNAILSYHRHFYQVVPISIQTHINEGFLSFGVVTVVKTHTDTAWLSQDLFDNVATQVIGEIFVRMGFGISFREFGSSFKADLSTDSGVICFGK